MIFTFIYLFLKLSLSSTISYRIFGADVVFVGMGYRGRGLMAIFWELFASASGVFILVGGWALGYHSIGFRHFPNVS